MLQNNPISIDKIFALRMFDIRLLNIQIENYFQWSINFQAFRNDEGFGWIKKTDILIGKITVDFRKLFFKKFFGLPMIKIVFKPEYGNSVHYDLTKFLIPEEYCSFYKRFLEYDDRIPLVSIFYFLSVVIKYIQQYENLSLYKIHNKIFHLSDLEIDSCLTEDDKNFCLSQDDINFCFAEICELSLMSSLDLVTAKDWRGKIGPKVFHHDLMELDTHWIFKYILFDGKDLFDDIPAFNPVTGNMTSYRHIGKPICIAAERVVYMIYGKEVVTLCFLNDNNDVSIFYLRSRPDLFTIVHRDSFEEISK